MTIESRLEALRREFDESFSVAHRELHRELEDFLLVRVADDPYALRLGEIAALASRRTIVPLPSRRPEFLGLAGHRGSLAAIFSLPRLLGYPAASGTPGWFVLLRAAGGIALAFDAYEGHARVPASEQTPIGDAARRRFVARAVRHGGRVRPVVDIPGILVALEESKS
jgi:chemotaxis signal transduction protein